MVNLGHGDPSEAQAGRTTGRGSASTGPSAEYLADDGGQIRRLRQWLQAQRRHELQPLPLVTYDALAAIIAGQKIRLVFNASRAAVQVALVDERNLVQHVLGLLQE